MRLRATGVSRSGLVGRRRPASSRASRDTRAPARWKVSRAGAPTSTSASASLPHDRDGDLDLNTEASKGTVARSPTAAETATLQDRATAAYSAEVGDLLLASLAQVLVRWTGRDDVLVDVEDHRRPTLFDDVDLSRTIGCCATVVPVKLEIGNRSLADLVQRTTEMLRRVHHRGLSFGALRYLSQDGTVRKSLEAVPQPQLRFHFVAESDAIPPGSSCSRRRRSRPMPGRDNRRSHLLEVVAFMRMAASAPVDAQQPLPRRRTISALQAAVSTAFGSSWCSGRIGPDRSAAFRLFARRLSASEIDRPGGRFR